MVAPAVTKELKGTGEDLDLPGMQGLVARAYGHLSFARYVFLGVGDPAGARRWLGSVVDDVTTADHRADADRGPELNLALTWAGLRALGLDDEALATFPLPLQEGIVTGHRSRILGDRGTSDPATWQWGGPGTPAVHVLLILYAETEAALDAAYHSRVAACTEGGALVDLGSAVDGRMLDTAGTEHFGFVDGVSQPILKGWPRPVRSQNPPAPEPPPRWTAVNPGEVVLGCEDNFGKPTEGPTVAATAAARDLPLAAWAKGRRHLGHAGTWLVARQLAQDVAGFRRFVSEAAARSTEAASPELLAAKIVGRWPNGTPLVVAPERPLPPGEDPNDFGYHVDQDGLGCPVGAHVRRANPRDSSVNAPELSLTSTMNHRILRRGRSYGLPLVDPPTRPGEEADAARGLMFICLNADVERQFEFVQGNWLDNPYFGGLYGEVDPLTGTQPGGGGTFTRAADPIRRRVTGLPQFVHVRGGGYFFLPGTAALRYLAAMDG